uniref:Protein SDE2 homolog isoform X2 n=1 Tax=Castor canadensis TaxID=51338 RepID=A0A8B7V8F1_CASCN|nr:protein SDE2 homolog isoform X2 [Castor canadensis]
MAAAAVWVWVRGPGFGCKAVRCASARYSVLDVIHRHCQNQGVPVEYFFVKCSGALVSTSDTVQHGAVYTLEPRLCGGKGGFGSMLRALGAQIEKTTNREACRDLSGRRLRDVNHEKAMAEWVKQQAEREAEKEQKRLERLQRKLAEPKHCFTNPDYQQQCHEMAERLEDSVLKGMQAASSKVVSAEISENRKRPSKSRNEEEASAKKRKCFWLGVEGLETAEGSSCGSSDDDDDREATPGTSGVSCSAPQDDSGCDEMAAEGSCSSPRVVVLNSDSVSPAKPHSLVTDTGKGTPEGCTELGEASMDKHRVEKEGGEAEDPCRRQKAESHQPREKDAASTVLNKDRETEKMTGGDRAAQVEPGEDRADLPAARLEGSQAGNSRKPTIFTIPQGHAACSLEWMRSL